MSLFANLVAFSTLGLVIYLGAARIMVDQIDFKIYFA